MTLTSRRGKSPSRGRLAKQPLSARMRVVRHGGHGTSMPLPANTSSSSTQYRCGSTTPTAIAARHHPTITTSRDADACPNAESQQATNGQQRQRARLRHGVELDADVVQREIIADGGRGQVADAQRRQPGRCGGELPCRFLPVPLRGAGQIDAKRGLPSISNTRFAGASPVPP